MDALQVLSSATQIVSSMVGAVVALEQASRNLDEAPKRIQNLEKFIFELEILTRRMKQKHTHKLHNPQLEHQIQSLNELIKRLHPNIGKARKIVSKRDPLSKLIRSIQDDLNWWLESQKLAGDVEKVIDSTAQNTPVRLRISGVQGYPISNKCHYLINLLEQECSHRVILIVGLSGIGKSCLARQVASATPMKFIHGAIELRFGQWCSRVACNGSKAEYQKRLARKICKFLVQIGFWKKIRDDNSGDLDYVCYLLQEAFFGKSILILLDDVWEQDIVERFANMFDNDCRFLVTTRNEAVYEITEAAKVEICKDDTREISKAILLYHSLLNLDELPSVAESLLERCGHHPLTVAVMGKALRKETRAETLERAISNLSIYATCAPGPISYVNEKEAENKLTIFGSFEFSLEAMLEDSRRLFIALAVLSWAESIPEACLEALWLVLGQDTLFLLAVCKLVEGSLLIKTDSYPMYQVHDMVSLYLDSRTNEAVEMLLSVSTPDVTASITPWLFIFGKEEVKIIVEQKMNSSLDVLKEKQAIITLEAIVQALMASNSISELEASRASFCSILGPRTTDLIYFGSPDLVAGFARAISNIFSKNDYNEYVQSLETVGAVDKLAHVLENCEDPMTQTNISMVLAKFAEYGSPDTIDKVLQSIPINRLVDLLASNTEEWHESVFTMLISLTKAGKLKAIEKMFDFGVDKSLIKLLENGSEVTQHHAIVTLKVFYELGGPHVNRFLRSGTLNLLPWHARLSLERFVLSDRNVPIAPKIQTFEDLIHKILDRDQNLVLEAMQELVSVIEKAGEATIREMIIQSPLIERLSELLQLGHSGNNSTRSESAFLLMKLACSGGEPCIRKFLEYDVVPELVKMMQCNIVELQDSAYTTLHQMLFGQGGTLVFNRIVQMGFIERLAHLVESKSHKTREVCVHCIHDLVEVGNKASINQMFSFQVVEKLARLEKNVGGSGDMVVGFLKGMDKCKNLSTAERRVMKQQVVRKVRVALKGYKFEARIVAAVEACVGERSRGASTSRQKKI